MTGLILEGGTFRPIFSCGVMDALLQHQIQFDYVIGVSAGITNAFSYFSGQRGRSLQAMQRFRHDKRYLSVRNYFSNGSLFGLDFIFDTMPNELLPFDWEAFYKYPGEIRVGVTNAHTGEAEYLNGHLLDHSYTMLRATCAIPLYFPPIQIGQQLYYDGGIADSIPIRKALADGCTKNLIVLTQPAGYRKRLTRRSRAAAQILRRHYPQMAEAMRSRPRRYNETVCFCEHLAQHDHTVLIRPQTPIHSFESNMGRLEAAYCEGYRLALSKMKEIRQLFSPLP